MLDVQEEKTIIRPEEFVALVNIYKTALAQPGFSQDEERRKQFAKYVILAFRGGMTNPYELKAHCLSVAKEEYSGPVTQ